MFIVAALYHFVPLPDYVTYRNDVEELCREQGILGTLLLAHEGINGTISGSRQGIDRVLAGLRSRAELAPLVHKESISEVNPFYRLKVRLKKEIVTMGVPGVSPIQKVGTYVDAKDWNAVISDPEVILVDTRNDYEVSIGSFEGALDPKTHTFRQFPDYVKANLDPKKHKKVAMYCTGGIRCEKASSYLKDQGFEEVFHLRGGILKYLEEVPKEESLWHGECFVFDKRVTVDHDLKQGVFDFCQGCRGAVSPEDKKSPKYVPGVSCPRCHDALTPEQKKRFEQRVKQLKLAEERGELHGKWREG